ncbi:hypothetical protein [Spirochaeta cellobiosiphila]|uniref:hypothetical protein n=1 Tax=Spirochaeta cellobiosiphila TaxID=504483 RepID=UPI0004060572|nr:hypothetical protein [Spirochaeta cellobiosiphila]
MAVVMGRNTFEKVLTFEEWPYDKKVFVLSNTLQNVPQKLSDKVQIITDHIPDIVRKS